jgi:hypothetical protein
MRSGTVRFAERGRVGGAAAGLRAPCHPSLIVEAD